MSKPKKKVTKTKKAAPEYSASIKIFGKIYKSTGATITEAIMNLKPGGVARGMSVLTVSKGGVSKDRILPSFQTSRLFSPSKITREIALKSTSLRFDL